MKKISKQDDFVISKKMTECARDVDMCLYNVLTDYMDKDFMNDALSLYLSTDGAFANGLNIDNYNINSSVYQIYEGFKYMTMAGLDKTCKHDMFSVIVNKNFNVLYNRAEKIDNKWNPNVSSTDDFAHNIIFENNEENRKLFGYGPTAALLGYTLRFCAPTKAYYKKALKMIDIMLKDFYQMDKLTKYEFIGFNSFLNSLRFENILKEDQIKIEEKLIKLAKEVVSTDYNDPTKILPLDCALYLNDEELKKLIDDQLDYIIDSRAPHGLWEHKGGWGHNKYPEEDTAMMKWIGAESVLNYFYLKKFGRVE